MTMISSVRTAELREVLGSNLFAKTYEKFWSEFQENLPTILDPLTPVESRHRVIHTQKGASGMLGLNWLHTLLFDLEKALQDSNETIFKEKCADLLAGIGCLEREISTLIEKG